MKNFSTLATKNEIKKTIEALKKNGIEAILVENGSQAKREVLKLLPKGAEVLTMTSVTLDAIGLSSEINDSENYISVKNKLFSMNRETQGDEMQRVGTAPSFTVGSVHAVTKDGKVVIASNTGSQLPAYAYGASQVIWVVGAQKIVSDLDEAFKRIYEYSLPLESERAKKAYGVPGSSVNKILIVNKEVNSQRIRIIFVNEVLGY